jgi:formate/nitrite transporter
MVESNVSHSEFTASRHYLIPKEIADALVALGQHKAAHTPLWKTLIGALFAGCYVSFGGMCAITAAGGLDPAFAKAYPAVPKFIVGITFWIALILIMTLGGELFTGNLMYTFLARLHGRCTTLQMLTNWLIVFWGNWAACAFCGFILAYKGELYTSEPYLSYLHSLTMHKIELDWDVVVCRAIGANWMVCCAVGLSIASQDQLSRTVSCFLPVFIFALIGFEHCIASQFYVSLGLMYGADSTLGEFIWRNLIPSVIGNFIGGALICGGGMHLLFLYDSESHEVTPPTKSEEMAVDDLKAQVAFGRSGKDQSTGLGGVQGDVLATPVFPSVRFVKRFLRRTGEVIRMAVKTTIILDENGTPTRIFSTLRNVTQSDNGHGAGSQTVTTGTAVQEGCLSVMWNGEDEIETSPIILADTIICQILGYSREELVGKQLNSITYSEDAHLSTR